MKINFNFNFRYTIIPVFLFLLLFISSCSNYYFSSPQPVDSENIHKFPKQFRGTYLDREKDEDTDKVALQIFEKSIKFYVDKDLKIINGIYVNPGDTVGFQKEDSTHEMGGWSKHLAADWPFESTQSIKFDSLNHPKDTVRNYIIQGNKIYKIADGKLAPGRTCSIRNDTIYVESAFTIELGPLACLRKLAPDMYVLNIASLSSHDDYEMSNFWWEFGILEMTRDGKLVVRELKEEYHSKPMYHLFGSSSYYFDNQWTKNEMLNLLEDRDTTKEGYRPIKNYKK